MEQEQNITPPVAQEPAKMTPPPQENVFPSTEPKSPASTYALIGGLVVLVVIVLGAWYTLMKDKSDVTVLPIYPAPTVQAPPAVTTPIAPDAGETLVAPDATTADSATSAMKVQGTSDELSSIESDLGATDMSTLGDINQI